MADDTSDTEDMLAAGRSSSTTAANSRNQPAYESLYVPELLLAVLSEPHADVLQQWLPLADVILTAAADEVCVQGRLGIAAAAAAFPAGQQQQQGALSGALPLQPENAAAAAAADRQVSTLLQLQGYAAAGQQLLMTWRTADSSSSSSGAACLVDQLKQLLPPLVSVTAAAANAGDGGGADAAAAAAGAADGQAAAAAAGSAADAAAAAAAATRGAASVAGVPPPWGKDVDPTAAVGLVTAKYDLAAALGAFNLLSLLLNGPPDLVRQLAAADRPNERTTLKPGLNPAAASNPNGNLNQSREADLRLGSSVSCISDGFEVQALVAEVLEAGVLDVLERGLRAGTCALEASGSDLLWGVRGGAAMVSRQLAYQACDVHAAPASTKILLSCSISCCTRNCVAATTSMQASNIPAPFKCCSMLRSSGVVFQGRCHVLILKLCCCCVPAG